MKKIFISFILFLLFLTGCSYKIVKNNSLEINEKKEIIDIWENPQYIYDEDFSLENVALSGVKLKDKEEKINQELIKEKINSAGWVHMLGGYGYRVADGKVVEFVFRKQMIDRVGLLREDEIIFKFGEPDKIEESYILDSEYKKYLYYKKGLIISWFKDSKFDSLKSINMISK